MDIKFSKLFQDAVDAKKTANFFDILDEKIATLKAQGVDVLDFGVGDPAKTLGTPDFILDELKQASHKRKFFGYPGNKGTEGYLNSVIQYLKNEHGVEVSKEEINITNGSKTAVCIIPRIFLEPQDIAICPCPGYPNFYTGVMLAHGVPYFVPLLPENDFLIDFEAIPEDIAQKAKIMWINYPNSPTGKIAPKEYLQRLIDWCHKYNIVLLSDEAYMDIYFGDTKPISAIGVSKKGVVSFFSLSKSANMTSHRIGFIAGDKEIIAKFYKLSNLHDDGVPHLIQDGASIALQNSLHLKNIRADYKLKKDLIVNALSEGFGCEKPKHAEGSIFLWQKAPKGLSGEEFANKLLELGIAVMPGSVFSAVGGFKEDPAKEYIRIALIPPLKVVKEAARRMLNEKI
jgi:LL-diaminopimelate aminotransferase